MLRWILAISWPLICWAVSLHFWTHHSGNWSQTWWIQSLWCSPGLIDLLVMLYWVPVVHGLWLVELFLYICTVGLSSDLVRKLIGASPGPTNFWSYSTEFLLLPGLWLVEELPFTDKLLININLLGKLIVGLPLTWLNCGLAPLNTHHFLTSELWSSF